MTKEYVYALFGRRDLSCNTDYDSDGFIIVDDNEEVGRNMSKDELITYFENDREDAWIEILARQKKLTTKKVKEIIADFDVEELIELMTNETENTFFKYDYQSATYLDSIHKTKESAEEEKEYKNNNHSYRSDYYVVKWDLRT